MNHRQHLEQLGLEKQKLIAALNEIEGAMKYAIQCLKSEAEPESGSHQIQRHQAKNQKQCHQS